MLAKTFFRVTNKFWKKRNFVHIHVGKCGGGTVNNALQYAGMRFEELHGKGAEKRLAELLGGGSVEREYIVSVRDPISRLLSAFNFDKYEKIIENKAQNPVWKSIYSTFESADHLALSLASEDLAVKDLAWVALGKR